ncbi:MAG: ABC transporter ATP-binding protein [Patescibacteria group bacterium]|nr:ABC transporter ATP-binding protein [Patescibacteria group bacterium]
MAILDIKNISKIYGSGHTEVKAIDNVSLQVNESEIVLIMGPSGSGKTTFLTMAGALLKPTSGSIFLNGQEITKLSEKELPKIRLQELGFVFQSFNLLASLTALENVAVPLIVAGVKKKEAFLKAKEALEKLGLGNRLSNLPRDLSGGEKQRVSIARALVNNPKLILADEPSANLDSKIGHEVMKQLCSVACEQKKAIVIVSHDDRIKDVAHRIINIEDGKIVKEEKGNHGQSCKM